MKAVVMSVDKINPWAKDGRTSYFVEGALNDGSLFSVWTKSEDEAKAAKDALSALIGQEHDFPSTRPPRENQGRLKHSFDGWPGKAPSSGGGGRPGFVPRFRDTEAGFAKEQASIHRSVALQHAVARVNAVGGPDSVLGVAESYYQWLSTGKVPDDQIPF